MLCNNGANGHSRACASKVEIVRGPLPSLVGVTVMGNDLTVRRRSPLQIESVRSRSRRACGV